jgi:exopolyphosphatase/guanosine-5'-triphosphate,3'-diphosphate pyrophosphatase
MEKWAAIDIGSNTVQLLVAGSEDAHFRPHFQISAGQTAYYRLPRLFFALRTTRLGASPEPGLLAPERIAATLAVLKEYRGMLISQGVGVVRVIATSAVRDAANRAVLLDAVREHCGWQVEVLSGQEEAYLSFLGASAPELFSGAQHILLLDIGGSSSELIRWREGRIKAVSADVGAVRAQMAGWQADEIERALTGVIKAEDDDSAALAIGAGGSITTAAALIQGCREYSREAVEGYDLKAQAMDELLEVLQPLSIKQRCAYSPLLARRGEIICEGLLIARTFLRILSLPGLKVSAGGVLEGCLLDLKQRGILPANKLL